MRWGGSASISGISRRRWMRNLRGLRLSPSDPRAGSFLGQLALAQYPQGNYEEAIRYSERTLQRHRSPYTLRTLVASLAQLGRTQEAEAALAELSAIPMVDAPRYWDAVAPYVDPAHRE